MCRISTITSSLHRQLYYLKCVAILLQTCDYAIPGLLLIYSVCSILFGLYAVRALLLVLSCFLFHSFFNCINFICFRELSDYVNDL